MKTLYKISLSVVLITILVFTASPTMGVTAFTPNSQNATTASLWGETSLLQILIGKYCSFFDACVTPNVGWNS